MTSSKPSRLAFIVALAFSLAACGGAGAMHGNSQTTNVTAAASKTTKDFEDVSGLDRLEAMSLSKNECGIFLWPARDQGKLVFHGNPEKKTGAVKISGTRVPLILTEPAEGTGAAPVALRSLDGRITGQLSFTLGARQGNMVVISSGLLKLAAKDDWQVVMPVGGFMGCQS